MMSARRGAPMWGNDAAGGAASASVAVMKRAPAAWASGRSMPASASAPMTVLAAESRMTYSSSAAGCDTASGTAVWAALGKFIPLATIDMRIDYLRPAFKGESVFARCECTKLTRRIAFTRGTAHVGDPAKPIAYSASTFMIGV